MSQARPREGIGQVSGMVETIRYRNQDNGYTVAIIDVGRTTETVVGTMLLEQGQTYEFEGMWEVSKWGEQLKVRNYKLSVPSTSRGIENYLGSGLFPQIGPQRAAAIVSLFGTKALEIIESTPERLLEVPGITDDRVKEIVQCYKDNKHREGLLTKLYEYGLTPWQVSKLYERYKDQVLEALAHDPYAPMFDVQGIGFKSADSIAARLGVRRDSLVRAKAAVYYVLKVAAECGHTYLPRVEVVRLAEAEDVPAHVTAAALDFYAEHHEAVSLAVDDVYLADLRRAEMQVAKVLGELSQPRPDVQEDIINEQFSDLNEEQAEAVKLSHSAGVMILTGGPGTGKTHTLARMRSDWEAVGKSVAYAAPTGKAAQRMTEMLGGIAQATTIHRLLGWTPDGFTYHFANPLSYGVVVIDEASMLDIQLASALLEAIDPRRTSVVLIGDVDQLPSVGPGAFLRDVIASGKVPTVRLCKIMRQNADSAIVRVAHSVNQGKPFTVNNKVDDVKWFELPANSQPVSAAEAVRGMVTHLSKVGYDPIQDVQVLCPIKRGPAGAIELGDSLQALLNPPEDSKPEVKVYSDSTYVLRLGDKVIQTKNNYTLDVFNGEVGLVTSVDMRTRTVTVEYGYARVVTYPSSLLAELKLAYALTVHKSQGSEFPVVIVPVHLCAGRLLIRPLLYTAITRARKVCALVGSVPALAKAIQNNVQAMRFTRLRNFMTGDDVTPSDISVEGDE